MGNDREPHAPDGSLPAAPVAGLLPPPPAGPMNGILKEGNEGSEERCFESLDVDGGGASLGDVDTVFNVVPLFD